MTRTNFILTGFMGTGKTTVGQLLAQQLDYSFIDTDQEIEQQAGQTVSEIFRTRSEAVFRQMETKLVNKLCRQQGLVIATGGGLVMNRKNVERLASTGQIICLTASVDAILERVQRQGGQRPLLNDPDPRNKILALKQEREAVYAQFPQLDTTGKKPSELIKEILQLSSHRPCN